MQFFTRSERPVRKNHTVTPSTNLSGGTVPNHVLHLTGRSSSGTGLLSPDLAAGIRRVKGAKRLGVRIGNWLTVDQSKNLLGEPPADHIRGKRDRAILALLIGCGLRRAELVGLGTQDFQVREERWVIADLIG